MPRPERRDRGEAFLFNPTHFMLDPAVVVMSEAEVGAYTLLLCHGWLAPEPGVLPDDDEALASLSRTGRRWGKYRAKVRAAFDAESRPGHLIQKRMVQEYRRQTAMHEHWKRAGKAGSEVRWGQRDKWPRDDKAMAKPSPGDSERGTWNVVRRRTSCGSGSALPGPDRPALPLKTGGLKTFTAGELDEMHGAFPGVDIPGELARMRAWLVANPSRQKTGRGVTRFVYSWLAKEFHEHRIRGGAAPEAPAKSISPPVTDAEEQAHRALADRHNAATRKGRSDNATEK